MGLKVTVDTIENVSHSSGLPKINENFEELADEFDDVMYRDGSLAATDDWDMDGNRILNLPAPLTSGEPARLGDLEQLTPAATVAVLATKADLADLEALEAQVAALDVEVETTRINVLDSMSDVVRAAVIARTQTASVITQINAAAALAVAADLPLHFPSGTYPLLSWKPPTNLRVTTDGVDTVFKQIDTGGTTYRLIHIENDGVRLWPDGAATLDGSTDTIPANANEFNAGLFLDPADGTTIKSFVAGDLYGRNIGGDVLTTYDGGTGYLHNWEVGNVYGFNCYRTVAAITAGRSGRIKSVIDQGVNAGEGTGIGVLFVEHDASINTPVENLEIGHVRGRIMNVVGVPLGARVGRVRIGTLDLDASRPYSSPAYDEAGLNIGTTPYLFGIGLAYREVDSIYIGSAKIANCPWDAIRDNGEAGVNWSNSVYIGSLELINNGASSNRSIVTQKTRSFHVGQLKDTDKVDTGYATFAGGKAGSSIIVDCIEGEGKLATTETDITVKNGAWAMDGQHLFYYSVGGHISIENFDITGAAASLFLGATKIPIVRNCTIAAPSSVLGSGGDAAPNAFFENTTIGATTYMNRLYTPPVATISDPAGGATVDAESRTAIAAIIDGLQAVGIVV